MERSAGNNRINAQNGAMYIKVRQQLKEAFEKKCEENGVTVSEKIRYLMELYVDGFQK